MRIESFDIHALETSHCALDGGAMFGVVPKVLWQKQITPDSENRIPLTTRSLLLLSDDRRILVDTGNGDKWNEKLRAIYAIDTDSVNIASALSEFELTTDDITDVICTHLHFDHAGGNTCLDKSGAVVPAFPNARYWIQKSNWERANNPLEKDKASYRSENWEVLAQNRMIEFVDGAESFIPGIDMELFEGHTEGQQLPKISDGVRTIFFAEISFPLLRILTSRGSWRLIIIRSRRSLRRRACWRERQMKSGFLYSNTISQRKLRRWSEAERCTVWPISSVWRMGRLSCRRTS